MQLGGEAAVNGLDFADAGLFHVGAQILTHVFGSLLQSLALVADALLYRLDRLDFSGQVERDGGDGLTFLDEFAFQRFQGVRYDLFRQVGVS